MQPLMRRVEETTTGAIFTPLIESIFLPDTYPGYLFKSRKSLAGRKTERKYRNYAFLSILLKIRRSLPVKGIHERAESQGGNFASGGKKVGELCRSRLR
jgi:hypothetical protein